MNPCLVRGGCAGDILGRMAHKNNFCSAGAFVLGMHDALVSLTGLIVGLAVAMADRHAIILTSIIASITASLSMAASNYLAQRTNNNSHAIRDAIYTGGAYMATCVLLILPFVIFQNRTVEIVAMFGVAGIEIFTFNWFLGRTRKRPYIRKFLEMLGLCIGVSIVAFFIGLGAHVCLGIDI